MSNCSAFANCLSVFDNFVGLALKGLRLSKCILLKNAKMQLAFSISCFCLLLLV